MIIGSSNVTVSVNVATPSGLSRWASPVDVSSALAFDPGTGAAHATVETRAASATTATVHAFPGAHALALDVSAYGLMPMAAPLVLSLFVVCEPHAGWRFPARAPMAHTIAVWAVSCEAVGDASARLICAVW